LQKAFLSLATRKERPSRDESSLTSESVKSPVLRLGLSSSSELEESSLEKLRSLRAAHHLLELLLLLVPEAVLLLVVVLAVVVLLGVVILVGGGVEFLPLGAVDDEVGGVTTLEAAPRRSPPLLTEPVQSSKLSRQQGDLVVGDALVLLIRSCTQRRQDKL
jgi:hypothetical protein